MSINLTCRRGHTGPFQYYETRSVAMTVVEAYTDGTAVVAKSTEHDEVVDAENSTIVCECGDTVLTGVTAQYQ